MPDGAELAYQTLGEGPLDIVVVHNWVWCIDLMWDQPMLERALLSLADLGRLVVFDKRGNGASDPVWLDDMPFLNPVVEQAAEDLRVLLDEVGSTSACVIGADLGGWTAMLAAATFPERVESLALMDSCARVVRAPDYPIGIPQSAIDAFLAELPRRWGTGWTLSAYSPRLTADPSFMEWYGRFERLSVTPWMMRTSWSNMTRLDTRAMLGTIRVPTLVVAHEDARWVRADHSRYLAERIPGAELVLLPGADMFFGSDPRVFEELARFVTGASGARDPRYADRVLAAVLFTDLVSSTERLVQMGDRRWRELLDEHDAIVRRQVERHRGRFIKSTGDGALATFGGPARAVQAAIGIRDDVARLGVDVRAGVHAGEVELRGDDVGGVAVHIAARVLDLAEPGEILVSRTVRDLSAGSGLALGDRGEQRLKGIDEPWRLYRVQA